MHCWTPRWINLRKTACYERQPQLVALSARRAAALVDLDRLLKLSKERYVVRYRTQ